MTNACLSISELLQLREQPETVEQLSRDHARSCPRCSALLESLPGIAPPEFEATSAGAVATRAPVDAGDSPRAGQLWTTMSSHGLRFVVAVLGRPQWAPETVLVVPTSTRVEQASDLDLTADEKTLGYPVLLEVWNQGRVKAEQLETPVGQLPDRETELLKELHKALVTGKEPPPNERTGVPIVNAADPRRLFRAEEAERYRPLWSPLRQEAEEEDALVLASATTVAALLTPVLAGDEWDRAALAEAAQTEVSVIDRFLKDKLDFPKQSDVDPLVRISKRIGFPLDEVEQAVSASFQQAPVGTAVVPAKLDRRAARSRGGVPEELRTSELYRGERRKADASQKGQTQALESYLQALRESWEELS